MKRVALFCALLSVASAQLNQLDQVHQLILNDANLIETARGYAINAPNLLQNNWKTVSVNGDNVVIVSPNCQQTVLTKQALTSTPDQQNLIADAKQTLYAVERGNTYGAGQPVSRSGSIRFSLYGNSASMNNGRNIGMSSFSNNGLSITKFDSQSMTISKTGGFGDNIARIFVSGDVVTYVYQDGRVMMKPTACLQPAEQQLIQQLRQEAQEAQRRFEESMQQFNSNMQNMNHRLQQNMQNMQQNMQQNMHNSMTQLQNSLNNAFGRGGSGPYQFGARNMGMPNQQQQMQTLNGFNGMASYMGAGNGYGSSALMNGMMGNTPGVFTQAGNGMASAAAGSGIWPFGPNNNPFGHGFPFGR